MTKNIVPGESVYGEKRISVDVSCPIILFSCVCSTMIKFMRALFSSSKSVT